MHFHDPSQRETKELAPGILARTFWGEKMLVSMVTVEPDTPLAEHHHPHEQVGTVLAGSITFTVGDETRTLKTGNVFVIPGDVPHSAVSGPDGATVMDVFSPVREDLQY